MNNNLFLALWWSYWLPRCFWWMLVWNDRS